MDIRTRLLIWLHGEYVGEDEFGNRYYQSKKNHRNNKKKRWIAYKGRPEASKIPADWHGWIHHTVQEPPIPHKKFFWEKAHLCNFTGTSKAYFPKAWLLSLDDSRHPRDKKRHYEPWHPLN